MNRVHRQVRQMSMQLTWKYHRQKFLLLRVLHRNRIRTDRGESKIYSIIFRNARIAKRRRTNVTRASCQKISLGSGGQKTCRELRTADHKVVNEDHASRMQHKYAVVVQVLATQWNQYYPCKTKISSRDDEKPSKLHTPRINPRSIYADNSLEFIKACEELNWNHGRSTPRRSETKEIAERAVRRVKEGTSPVLVQSGLQESWWAEAMECYCYLRHLQDLPADGQTPYERRFNLPFDEPIIPFWSRSTIPPCYCKRRRSSASVRHKSPSWHVYGDTP